MVEFRVVGEVAALFCLNLSKSSIQGCRRSSSAEDHDSSFVRRKTTVDLARVVFKASIAFETAALLAISLQDSNRGVVAPGLQSGGAPR